MASCNPSTPNPQTVPRRGKVFLHWDLSGIPDGCYEVRVLPTIDGVQLPDAPSATIYKDCNDPDIEEYTNNEGVHETQIKVFRNIAQEVEHGDPIGAAGDAPDRQPSTLTIPESLLDQDTRVTISFPDPDDPGINELADFSSGREYREVRLESGQTDFPPGMEMKVEMAYHDEDDDGIVDQTPENVDETQLRMYMYMDESWVEVPRATVNPEFNIVTAYTDHLTLFALLSPKSCTLTCDAMADQIGGIAPLNVNFTGTFDAVSCSEQPSSHWDFGNGDTSNEQNVSYAYSTPGSYTWIYTVSAETATCIRQGVIEVWDSSKPGDCNRDGTVTIGEVQRAINMFLGVVPISCGVDCNGDGEVSIGEVQKVINRFLGLVTGC